MNTLEENSKSLIMSSQRARIDKEGKAELTKNLTAEPKKNPQEQREFYRSTFQELLEEGLSSISLDEKREVAGLLEEYTDDPEVFGWKLLIQKLNETFRGEFTPEKWENIRKSLIPNKTFLKEMLKIVQENIQEEQEETRFFYQENSRYN